MIVRVHVGLCTRCRTVLELVYSCKIKILTALYRRRPTVNLYNTVDDSPF